MPTSCEVLVAGSEVSRFGRFPDASLFDLAVPTVLAALKDAGSLSEAHAAARNVTAGRVWINCCNLFPSGASFGGMKASGFGHEDAFETLLEFTEVKNVVIDTASSYRRFYE